jgi:hypothetical protein
VHKLEIVKREVTLAISNSTGLSVEDLVLVPPSSIPITTSGNVRRAAGVEQAVSRLADAPGRAPERDPSRRRCSQGAAVLAHRPVQPPPTIKPRSDKPIRNQSGRHGRHTKIGARERGW